MKKGNFCRLQGNLLIDIKVILKQILISFYLGLSPANGIFGSTKNSHLVPHFSKNYIKHLKYDYYLKSKPQRWTIIQGNKNEAVTHYYISVMLTTTVY